MKKLFRIFMLAAYVVCSLALASCSNDDEPATDCYVRYSVGIQPGSDVFISYMGVDGEKIVQGVHNEGKVEVTVGPVAKGFETGLAASVDGHASDLSAIEVARGKEPFVQRIYLANAVHISYTVSD